MSSPKPVASPSTAPGSPAAAAAHGPVVDTSPHTSEDDSQYGSGNESSTTSVTSSIFNYEYENGRRYHAFRAGTYALPNDEKEQDRLDLMHHIYLLMLGGKLFESPICEAPSRILDLGTGTGIWALDIADLYPSAQVIGTDLSPIQPRWVPPNLQFLVDDLEETWMFDSGVFDLIHIRGLVGHVKDWNKLLKQCWTHLKPGGCVELFEMPRFEMFCDDGTYEGSALQKYYSSVEKASMKAGSSLSLEKDDTMETMLEAQGFHVTRPVTRTTLPLGTWPKDKLQKELGKWAAVTLETGFEAYGMALLTRVLGMKRDEVAQLIKECQKEVRERSVHCYCIMRNYVAQKPEDAED
ncbi:S-adenosyl-L-methionine-dependent methyltransferase [Geopyxis carbonaria]|nr:S-adenosyl-L-methionine-dependent methyltransferase [Geopyxis carbonaria]